MSASRLAGEGTNLGDFDAGDWGLLVATSAIWGSSFLWIAIGLDNFHPGVIAWGRMVFGAAILWLVPASRRSVPLTEWKRLGVIAVAGNAFPAVFFPLAQQRIESSVAGMLNSIGPILTLMLSIAMLRKAPPSTQIVGLVIGLVGSVMLAAPNLAGADAEPLGVLFAMTAVFGYSISNNILPPVVQRYGGAAVIARAMLASAVLLAPWGLWALPRSEYDWGSLAAVAILGIFGTGLARTLFAILNGRIGAPRAALVGYLVPVVAVVLGVTVRGESVGVFELAGTALILVGAGLISRSR